MEDGLILVYKEKGKTSRKVVEEIAKKYNKKAGHIGTLDPMATGMLPVLIGNSTKLSKYLIEHDKIYLVEMKFGYLTDTLDIEGEILEEDVYLLSLGAPYETDQLKIYIPKASVYDKEQLDKDGKLVSKNILVYPFLTENWESNINEAKPYEAEDFW